MRNALKIAAAALCIIAAPMARAIGGDDCIAARPAEFNGIAAAADGSLRRPELNLTHAGRHCLADDLHQRKLTDPRTGREMKTLGGNAVVLIGADDVSLDLAGHAVSNDRELGYTLVKQDRYEPGRGHFHAFVRTRIHNGSLFSPGSRGIGIRLVSSRVYDTRGFGMPVRIPQGSKPADVYRNTSHVLEDLLIEAGSRAILLDGANNVVRNNRIRVDSATAIIAQGPGILIENNLIEVRGNWRTLREADQAAEAQVLSVIRLIQADGAVVRHNRVRLVDGPSDDPLPAAIDLIASRDVLVEDNIIQGMQTVIDADADSEYREARNSLQACRPDAVRFVPPDEAGDRAVARDPSCRRRSAPAAGQGNDQRVDLRQGDSVK